MPYVNKSDIYKLFDESNGVIRLHIVDVDMLPTADVVEVKHGHWIDDMKVISTVAGVERKTVVGYRCSLCNRVEFAKEPYCNCGAKMDVSKMEITTEGGKAE